jgi:hypothetical protein
VTVQTDRPELPKVAVVPDYVRKYDSNVVLAYPARTEPGELEPTRRWLEEIFNGEEGETSISADLAGFDYGREAILLTPEFITRGTLLYIENRVLDLLNPRFWGRCTVTATIVRAYNDAPRGGLVEVEVDAFHVASASEGFSEERMALLRGHALVHRASRVPGKSDQLFAFSILDPFTDPDATVVKILASVGLMRTESTGMQPIQFGNPEWRQDLFESTTNQLGSCLWTDPMTLIATPTGPPPGVG